MAAGLAAGVRVAAGPRQAAELELAVGAQVGAGLLLVGASGDGSAPRRACGAVLGTGRQASPR